MKALLPNFPVPATAFLALLNRLLQQEAWAMARLSKHSGQSVKLALGSKVSIKAGISSDGLMHVSDPAIKPNVTLSVPAESLGRIPQLARQKNADQFAQIVHIEGDASLAQTLSYLAQNLRWDAAHTLSKYVGDIAALRILRGGSSVFRHATASAGSLAENIGEFISHESGLMANRQAFSAWKLQMESALGQINTIEQRVNALAITKASSQPQSNTAVKQPNSNNSNQTAGLNVPGQENV